MQLVDKVLQPNNSRHTEAQYVLNEQ